MLGWVLLTAAWTIGNPPFAAPDESDHYIRALGISSGDLVGRPAPEKRALTPAQIPVGAAATRSVAVPEALAVGRGAGCYVFDAARSAGCLDSDVPANVPRQITPVGTYQRGCGAPSA